MTARKLITLGSIVLIFLLHLSGCSESPVSPPTPEPDPQPTPQQSPPLLRCAIGTDNLIDLVVEPGYALLEFDDVIRVNGQIGGAELVRERFTVGLESTVNDLVDWLQTTFFNDGRNLYVTLTDEGALSIENLDANIVGFSLCVTGRTTFNGLFEIRDFPLLLRYEFPPFLIQAAAH